MWSAYSGSHFEMGSSSRKRPSSNSIMSAADTIGLVIDAISKMVSGVIGWPASLSRNPCASRCTTSPRRATRVTAPAICFVSMYSWM